MEWALLIFVFLNEPQITVISMESAEHCYRAQHQLQANLKIRGKRLTDLRSIDIHCIQTAGEHDPDAAMDALMSTFIEDLDRFERELRNRESPHPPKRD